MEERKNSKVLLSAQYPRQVIVTLKTVTLIMENDQSKSAQHDQSAQVPPPTRMLHIWEKAREGARHVSEAKVAATRKQRQQRCAIPERIKLRPRTARMRASHSGVEKDEAGIENSRVVVDHQDEIPEMKQGSSSGFIGWFLGLCWLKIWAVKNWGCGHLGCLRSLRSKQKGKDKEAYSCV